MEACFEVKVYRKSTRYFFTRLCILMFNETLLSCFPFQSFYMNDKLRNFYRVLTTNKVNLEFISTMEGKSMLKVYVDM